MSFHYGAQISLLRVFVGRKCDFNMVLNPKGEACEEDDDSNQELMNEMDNHPPHHHPMT